MSASSSGSTRTMCGPAASPAITKSPLSFSVKPPTSVPVAGLNATTCAPIDAAPVLHHATGDAAGVARCGSTPCRGPRRRRCRPPAARDRRWRRASTRSETSPRRCRGRGGHRWPVRSVSPIAEWPRPTRCPSSCRTTDSTSTRPASPLAATDQGNCVLKKMSASTISPVAASSSRLVAPSTRSRSGRSRKPSVLRPSS